MDTIVKDKIDLFFTPFVSSLFFSSLEHNIQLIKKDIDIQQFCNRELCQSILYINKAKNIYGLPDEIMNIIKSYTFKGYVNYKCIKFYWYNQYMNDLLKYETEDRFDIMWYSIDSKEVIWARRRLAIIEAFKITIGLRLGYKEGDLQKYSRFI